MKMPEKMPEKSSVTLLGKVGKLLPSLSPEGTETAQISLESVHELYRDVRIDNTLTDESGGKVSLKIGSPVEVTITAEAESTTVRSLAPVSRKP